MRRVLAASVLLLVLLPSPAAIAEGERDALFAAQDRERVEGDFAGALVLFRLAATSDDELVRAQARLGEARCLLRLRRPRDARPILEDLLSRPLPGDLLAAARRELELAREALSAAEPAAAPPAAGAGEGRDDEVVRRRAQEARDREERAHRAWLADYALSQARALYREARFSEAREWVTRALELSPGDPEARELLFRLGEAPGERELLVREVLRLLSFERRLRLQELRSRSDALISEGQELLLRGELDAAASRLTACLSLLDAHPSFDAELALRKTKAQEFLRRVTLRGGRAGEPETPVGDEADEERWRDALRELLREVGSAAQPGRRSVRIYDLSGFSDPVEEERSVFGRLVPSPRRPDPGPLFERLVPALFEPGGWGPGGHSALALGDELVVHAPETVHEAISRLLARAAARQDPPLRIAVLAIAVSPAKLGEAAAGAGVGFEEGAFALLAPGEPELLRDAVLSGGNGEVLGETTLAVPPEGTTGAELLRSINLLAIPGADGEGALRPQAYGVTLEVLPVRWLSGIGLAARASVVGLGTPLTLPAATRGEFQVPVLHREETAGVGTVRPGGGLALAGLGNPFTDRPTAPRSGLLLIVRAAGAGPSPGPSGGGIPETVPEGPVAIDLMGLDTALADEPAPPFRGEPPRPAASRAGFLLEHLRRELAGDFREGGDASLSIGRGLVWVGGDPGLVVRVRSVIEALNEHRGRVVTIHARAARISAAEESNLLSGLTAGGQVLAGEGVQAFLIAGEDRRRIAYFVAGARGRIPLLTGVVAARSTQLVNLSRVTRFRYLAEFRTDGAGQDWPVYASVDEGIAVEARPVVLGEGRVELMLGIRVARILAREADAASPPVQAVSAARARAALGPDDGLLLAGLPAPTPFEERRERLVVLVTAEAGMPK